MKRIVFIGNVYCRNDITFINNFWNYELSEFKF